MSNEHDSLHRYYRNKKCPFIDHHSLIVHYQVSVVLYITAQDSSSFCDFVYNQVSAVIKVESVCEVNHFS